MLAFLNRKEINVSQHEHLLLMYAFIKSFVWKKNMPTKNSFCLNLKSVLVWEYSSVRKDLWREPICQGRDGPDVKYGGPYPDRIPDISIDNAYSSLEKAAKYFFKSFTKNEKKKLKR